MYFFLLLRSASFLKILFCCPKITFLFTRIYMVHFTASIRANTTDFFFALMHFFLVLSNVRNKLGFFEMQNKKDLKMNLKHKKMFLIFFFAFKMKLDFYHEIDAICGLNSLNDFLINLISDYIIIRFGLSEYPNIKNQYLFITYL